MKALLVAVLGLAVAAPANAAFVTRETLISVQTAEDSLFLTGDGEDLGQVLETADTAAGAESGGALDGGRYAGYVGQGFGYALANGFFKYVVDGAPGSLWHVSLDTGGYVNNGGSGIASLYYELSHYDAASVLLSTRSSYVAVCAACAVQDFAEIADQWQLEAQAGDLLAFQFQTVAQQDTSIGGFGFANSRLTPALTVTAAAVPEPGTWAMLIAGFGAVGTVTRRRRDRVAA